MAKGVTGNKEVISYCQGGVKAANDYFVLKHILGFKNVKVYVGSWGEWGNRVDPAKYPVEK
jgi:thiosulfate/3-mercaptopyruvate sulfurtransferase